MFRACGKLWNFGQNWIDVSPSILIASDFRPLAQARAAMSASSRTAPGNHPKIPQPNLQSRIRKNRMTEIISTQTRRQFHPAFLYSPLALPLGSICGYERLSRTPPHPHARYFLRQPAAGREDPFPWILARNGSRVIGPRKRGDLGGPRDQAVVGIFDRVLSDPFGQINYTEE